MSRPEWSRYFMSLAHLSAERSTCTRRQVGAVATKDNRVLSTGYNGAPRGVIHCSKTGCLRDALGIKSGDRHDVCRGVHAEQNVIASAASYGVSISGSVLYVTHKPCNICLKMLINAGVRAVVYDFDYKDTQANLLLQQSNIMCIPFDEIVSSEAIKKQLKTVSL